MNKLLHYFYSFITSGKQRQSFLDANWIERLLKLSPVRYRRNLALIVLSWSPHYFYRGVSPEYMKMPYMEFCEKEFWRNKSSRENICSNFLASFFKDVDVVLDYGCGPGFLANSVSKYVKKVYAVDFSKGVLECARILNNTPNVVFMHTNQLDKIEDSSIDLVYSIAVIQHVTDDVFKEILVNLLRKIKKGGLILIHIVLDDDNWKCESDWKKDTSTKGRIKWHYGLNCFKRKKEEIAYIFENVGYHSVKITYLKEHCVEDFNEDVCNQHLVCAIK